MQFDPFNDPRRRQEQQAQAQPQQPQVDFAQAEAQRANLYAGAGIEFDRDADGRVFPKESERNRRLGVQPMAPREDGRIDIEQRRGIDQIATQVPQTEALLKQSRERRRVAQDIERGKRSELQLFDNQFGVQRQTEEVWNPESRSLDRVPRITFGVEVDEETQSALLQTREFLEEEHRRASLVINQIDAEVGRAQMERESWMQQVQQGLMAPQQKEPEVEEDGSLPPPVGSDEWYQRIEDHGGVQRTPETKAYDGETVASAKDALPAPEGYVRSVEGTDEGIRITDRKIEGFEESRQAQAQPEPGKSEQKARPDRFLQPETKAPRNTKELREQVDAFRELESELIGFVESLEKRTDLPESERRAFGESIIRRAGQVEAFAKRLNDAQVDLAMELQEESEQMAGDYGKAQMRGQMVLREREARNALEVLDSGASEAEIIKAAQGIGLDYSDTEGRLSDSQLRQIRSRANRRIRDAEKKLAKFDERFLTDGIKALTEIAVEDESARARMSEQGLPFVKTSMGVELHPMSFKPEWRRDRQEKYLWHKGHKIPSWEEAARQAVKAGDMTKDELEMMRPHWAAEALRQQELDDRSIFSIGKDSFLSAVHGTVGSAHSTASAVARRFGREGAAQRFEERYKDRLSRAAEYADSMLHIDDVQGPRDLVRAAMSAGAMASVSISTIMAGTYTGGKIGSMVLPGKGTIAGSIIGGFTAGHALYFGDAYATLLEQGVDEKDAFRIANMSAAPASAVSLYWPMAWQGLMMRAGGQALYKRTAAEAVKDYSKRLAVYGGGGSLLEGSAEGFAETFLIMGEQSAGIVISEEEAWSRRRNAAFAGSVFGGGMGVAPAVKLSGRMDANAATALLQEQFKMAEMRRPILEDAFVKRLEKMAEQGPLSKDQQKMLDYLKALPEMTKEEADAARELAPIDMESAKVMEWSKEDQALEIAKLMQKGMDIGATKKDLSESEANRLMVLFANNPGIMMEYHIRAHKINEEAGNRARKKAGELEGDALEEKIRSLMPEMRAEVIADKKFVAGLDKAVQDSIKGFEETQAREEREYQKIINSEIIRDPALNQTQEEAEEMGPEMDPMTFVFKAKGTDGNEVVIRVESRSLGSATEVLKKRGLTDIVATGQIASDVSPAPVARDIDKSKAHGKTLSEFIEARSPKNEKARANLTKAHRTAVLRAIENGDAIPESTGHADVDAATQVAREIGFDGKATRMIADVLAIANDARGESGPMKVEIVDSEHKIWTRGPRQGAVSSDGSTLYLNRDSMDGNESGLSVVVHEAGHAVGLTMSDFIVSEWQGLTAEQRREAAADYGGEMAELSDGELSASEVAAQEWFSFQFFRVLKSETTVENIQKSYGKRVADRIRDMVERFRKVITVLIGDKSLSTEALDKRISEIVGDYVAGQSVTKSTAQPKATRINIDHRPAREMLADQIAEEYNDASDPAIETAENKVSQEIVTEIFKFTKGGALKGKDKSATEIKKFLAELPGNLAGYTPAQRKRIRYVLDRLASVDAEIRTNPKKAADKYAKISYDKSIQRKSIASIEADYALNYILTDGGIEAPGLSNQEISDYTWNALDKAKQEQSTQKQNELSQEKTKEQQEAEQGQEGAVGAILDRKTVAPGSDFTARTPEANGVSVSGKWAVVDAGEVISSEQEGFIKELQPRDRKRAASQEQIAAIAASLSLERASQSPTSDTGAPVVDEAGMVLSGNGRTEAIRLAYRNNKKPSQQYKADLAEMAESLGIDRASVEAMESPMLVRVIQDYGGLAKKEFVRRSNKSVVSGMSLSEQAAQDAQMIIDSPNLSELFQPSESGGLMAASNRPFLNAFIEATGDAAELRTKDGYSPTLEARLKRALIAAAVGPTNASTINSLTEDVEGLKRVASAIAEAAPNLVRLNGTPFDISADLNAAVSEFISSVREGVSVDSMLAQQGLFGDQRTEVQERILKILGDHGKTSATKISAFLNEFAMRAMAVDTQTAEMDLGIDPTTREAIIQSLYEAESKGESDAESAQDDKPTVPGSKTKDTKGRPDKSSSGKAGSGLGEKWTLIGKNKDGKNLYEDANGVRAIEEAPGILSQEAISVVPDREQGTRIVKGKREKSFKTAEELAQEPAPEPKAQPPKKPKLTAEEKEIGDALEGLFSPEKANQAIVQKAIPFDTLMRLRPTVEKLITQGKSTPKDVVETLDRIAEAQGKPKGARVLSRSLYSVFIGVDPSLPDVSDWSAVFAEVDAESGAATDGKSVARIVSERLAAGESLSRTDLNQLKEESGLTAKEVDEWVEVGVTQAARSIIEQSRASGESDAQIYDKLVDLYDRQPNLTAKTSTSKIEQAYSTPVPFAFVASRMAKIDANKVVFEPTAGHGALLLESNPPKTYANELNDGRRSRLESMEIAADVDNSDATEQVVPDQYADVVIGNPPFGAIKNPDGSTVVWAMPDGGQTSSIDFQIVMQSLKAMKDNGRAVFLIGGLNKMIGSGSENRQEAYSKGQRGEFLKALYDNYNVIDYFTVSGDLYRKMGAGWPIDVIVVSGKGKARTALPSEKNPRILESWEALKNEVNKSDSQRFRERQQTQEDIQGVVDGVIDGIRGGGSGAVGQRPGAKTSSSRDRDSDGQKPGGSSSDGKSSGRPIRDVSDVLPGDGQVGIDSVRGQSGPSDVGVGRPAKPVVKAESQGDYLDKYVPGSKNAGFDTLIPKNISSAVRNALDRVEQKTGQAVDAYVTQKLGYKNEAEMMKHFAAEQIDALALAIYQSETGAALVVGDQTGIGKGRVAAGMIRYSINNGKVPIFVTAKPGLYSAMLEDLSDIGSADIVPIFTNNGETIKDPLGRVWKSGNMVPKVRKIKLTGELPKGADVLFTTYDQMRDVESGLTKKDKARFKRKNEAPPDGDRSAAIRSLIKKNKAVLVLDEAHKASGQSIAGFRMMNFVKEADSVLYLSATFAKRPDSMPVYMRTHIGLVGDGKPQTIIDAMSKGGVPLQQAVSIMLTESGQYVRRERDFKGVIYKTHVNTNTAERDTKIADAYIGGLRQIYAASINVKNAVENINKIIKDKAGSMSAKSTPKLESDNFAAKIHNMVSQYLLAIKAKSASDLAIEAVQEGVVAADGKKKRHKVIITVQNTMASPIKQLLESGEEVSFNGLLRNYLNQQRRIKTGKGEDASEIFIDREPMPGFESISDRRLMDMLVVREPTPDNPDAARINGDAAKELLRRVINAELVKVEQELTKIDLGDMPISPIDSMRRDIEAMGIKAGEITGRDFIIDSEGKMQMRNKSEMGTDGQLATLDLFNNSDTDVMIINASGSTGISAHASEKFKRQDPRMMIVAQANADINEFMQTLGRIHRSGQVELPYYTTLQTAIPAELRPAALLGKKMASLNANTTSNAKSEVSESSDVRFDFDKYSDEVIHKILLGDPGLVDMLGYGSDLLDDAGRVISLEAAKEKLKAEDDGDFGRKITGRMAIALVEEQTEFWSKAETDYANMISYLNEIGQNDLIAEELDIKAETIEQRPFTTGGATDSVFDGPSFIEKVRVEMGEKPPSGIEVMKMAEKVRSEKREEVRKANELLSKAYDDARNEAKAKENWADRQANWERSHLEKRQAVAQSLDYVGRLVQIGESSYGAVVDFKIDPAHILAPSKSFLTIRANTGKGTIRMPMSMVAENLKPAFQGGFDQIYDATMDWSSERMIITGNLLAAYAELSSSGSRSGKIITYTTSEGEIKTGIMLTAAALKDIEASRSARVELKTAEEAAAALQSRTNAIQNDSETVSISVENGKYKIYVPASKRFGGKFWQNKNINAALVGGEFAQTKNEMEGEIRPERLIDVLREIKDSGEQLFFKSKQRADGGEPLYSPELLESQTGIQSRRWNMLQRKKERGTLNIEEVAEMELIEKELGQEFLPFWEADNLPMNASEQDKINALKLRAQYEARLRGDDIASQQDLFEGGLFDEKGQGMLFSPEKVDVEYMQAVESGDMEAAQELVDEAAHARGYSLSHRRQNEADPRETGFVIQFTDQIPGEYPRNEGYGDFNYMLRREDLPHVTDIPWLIEWYAKSETMKDWASVNGIDPVADFDSLLVQAEKDMNPDNIVDSAGFWDSAEDVSQMWQENESRLLEEGIWGVATYDGAVVFDPASLRGLKSADPVTRDESGNVIPLSQRFNPVSDSILFSPPRVEIKPDVVEIINERTTTAEDPRSMMRKVFDWAQQKKLDARRTFVAGTADNLVNVKYGIDATLGAGAGSSLDAALNAWKHAHHTRDVRRMWEGWMLNGTYAYENGDITPIRGSRGFVSIYRDVYKQGRNKQESEYLTKLAESYLAALRGEELLKDGRERNFGFDRKGHIEALGRGEDVTVNDFWSQERAEQEIAKIKAEAEQYDFIPQFQKEYAQWNKHLLDYMENSGLINKDQRSQWESDVYVPLNRVMDAAEQARRILGPTASKDARKVAKLINRLKGGTGKVAILENISNNLGAILQEAVVNQAKQKIVMTMGHNGDLMERMPYKAVPLNTTREELIRVLAAQHYNELKVEGGIPEGLTRSQFINKAVKDAADGVYENLGIQTEAQLETRLQIWRMKRPEGENIMTVMVKGKPQFWKILDAPMMDSIMAMGPDIWQSSAATWLRPFNMAKRFLTEAITLSPSFVIANASRETVWSWVASKELALPGISLATGTAEMWGKEGLDVDLAGLGLGQGADWGGFRNNPMLPKNARKAIERMTKSELHDFKTSVLSSPKKLARFYSHVVETAEYANRYGLAKEVLARGGSHAEAAFQAKFLTNFSSHGGSDIVRALVYISPFLNSRIQGLYRIGHAAGGSSAATAKTARALFVMKAGIIVSATIGLMRINWDNPEYEELSQWDKDAYWHVFLGGQHFRIPKPFEVGAVFGTLPELMVEGFLGKIRNKDARDALWRMLTQTFAVDFRPQGILQIDELQKNKASFTGRPIESFGDQFLAPQDRYGVHTPESFKQIANAMPENLPKSLEFLQSPKQLEHVWRGLTGTLGTYTIDMADLMVRRAVDAPDPAANHWRDAPILRDVVGRFWRSPEPRTSKYVGQFYELYRETEDAMRQINRARERGEEARIDRIVGRQGDQLQAMPELKRINTQLSAISARTKEIRYDPFMSREDKREELRELTKQRNELARRGVSIGLPPPS